MEGICAWRLMNRKICVDFVIVIMYVIVKF